MTFNQLLEKLRNSEIEDRVKFTNGDMNGYFVKGELGEFKYHTGKEYSPANFFLSDFDRDDWEIL